LAQHDDIMLLQKSLIDFDLSTCQNEKELQQKLAAEINDLILNDFSKLVRILYRLDINEQRLKKILQENSGRDAGELIAGMMLEREIQKLKTRALTQPKTDIPDDEKW
jgi:hypothetical protein